MTASQIIEKHHHQLTKSQLLFLVWLADKYPEGVMRDKINYPNMKRSYLIDKTIPELRRIGVIQTRGLGTKFSKVIPVTSNQ